MTHPWSIGLVVAGLAAHASGQLTPGSFREQIDCLVDDRQCQIQRSKLVGLSDDLALELPNGELIPIGPRGCLPPVSKGGLIQVDCTVLDGPAYYFDASTRLMVETCSFWFPDLKRCPPKQWPIDVPGCAGEVPPSLGGSWRLFALPGSGGFHVLDRGWTMTLSDNTFTLDFSPSARLERRYRVLQQDDERYVLELSDDQSATTRLDFELAACGLFVESDGVCDDFCANLAEQIGVPTEEQISELAEQMAGQNAVSFERIAESIRRSIAQGPRQPFPERSFFVPQ